MLWVGWGGGPTSSCGMQPLHPCAHTQRRVPKAVVVSTLLQGPAYAEGDAAEEGH